MSNRILILATKDGPYSYLALQSIIKHNIPLFGVALDKKGVGTKAIEIWEQRTAGRLKTGNIYEFQSQDCPFYEFLSHSNEEFENFVKENEIDLLVNAGTPHILKQNILNAPRIGVLNVHPSLLPAYRGCTTMEWSVLNDAPIGNTAHFMNSAIDEGPIIQQESYLFKKTDTYTDIRSQLYDFNVKLMAQVIQNIIEFGIQPESLPQQSEGQYWNVMDEARIELVKQKLINGHYKYQR